MCNDFNGIPQTFHNFFNSPYKEMTLRQEPINQKIPGQLYMKYWCGIWWVTKLSFLNLFLDFYKPTFSVITQRDWTLPLWKNKTWSLQVAGWDWAVSISSLIFLLALFFPEQQQKKPQTLGSFNPFELHVGPGAALICGGSCSPTLLSAGEINTEAQQNFSFFQCSWPT